MRQGIAGFVGNSRYGISGFFRPYYSSTSVAPPVFAGTIPDISVDFDSGSYNYDYSSYFTGATSYSISPSLESGWSFNTSTCVLTIDTDDASTFGPFTITGTNVSGSDSSNAFSVTVTQQVDTPSGGFWFAYDYEYQQRKRKKKELEEMERKAKALQDKIDRELALELQEDEKDRQRIDELKRLANLAKEHEKDVEQLGDRVKIAYTRAIKQANYSAMEAFEREVRRAREEEDWLIRITLELLH